jgi:hypothetical protein
MEVPIEASPEMCGACGKTVRIAAAVATEGGLLCPLCFTKADITAARRRVGFEGSAVALVGAIAMVIAFVAQAASPAMAGGASRPDWIAFASGLVAAACGGSTVAEARARARLGWLMVGALGMALGAYHAARGAGLIG